MRYVLATLLGVLVAGISACTPTADVGPADRMPFGEVRPVVEWQTPHWAITPARQTQPRAQATTGRQTGQSNRSSARPAQSTQSKWEEPPNPQPSRPHCDWSANLKRATAGRPAKWTVEDTGAWGRAQVPGLRIWIAPRTPCDKVYSVAVPSGSTTCRASCTATTGMSWSGGSRHTAGPRSLPTVAR